MTRAAVVAFIPLLLLLNSCGAEPSTRGGDFVDRAVAHYRTVERELREADTGHLTPRQRAERGQLLDELRIYRERRDFTVNADFPGARVPYFVDDEGRRCAVAHLLHVWGEDKLVARVAATDNHAYVSDLARDPGVVAWLDRVGITAWEAARIQVPGRVPPEEDEPPAELPAPPIPPVTPGQTPGDDPETPGAPTPESPGAGRGTGGPPNPRAGTAGAGAGTGSPGPGSPRPTSTGRTPGVPGGGGTLGGRPSAPRAGNGRGASRGAESWWLWWEFNKLDYLAANPLRIEGGTITGTRTEESRQRERRRAADRRRAVVLPSLRAELRHDDARVRGAAVIAVGRVGGPAVVEDLTRMLDDPQRWVRERAILALGATGAEDAGVILLRIARTGTHPARRNDTISPNARPLGILGLGLLDRYRGGTEHDAAVAELVSTAKKRDLEDLGGAGLLHGVLSPGAKIEAATVKIALDRNAPDPVRARAIERLGVISDDRAMQTLQRTLAGSRLELRRSAALALALVKNDLILPRLMTAFELEKEPLTRGFLLLAIADHGGSRGTQFLIRNLETGPSLLRPWAALALGLAARAGDADALPPLRKATLTKADQGAIWLALGLARDTRSIPALVTALGKPGSPRVRSHAATALALIGGERARHALLSRQDGERSPGVKVVIAQCLGVLGRDEDAVVLLRALRSATRPEYSGVMAVGLGYHGGEETLSGLTGMLAEKGLDPVVRGTVIGAIGLLLDRRPGLEFTALSRRTNFAIVPNWLYPALLSTL